MRHANRTLRAPVAARALAAVASPVIAYFVARLALHFLDLPELAVYAVCLLVGILLGYRAWSARIVLRETELKVHNTLLSQTVPRGGVRRVPESGHVEWNSGSRRSTRSPAEALRKPWWAVGGARTYARNREELRSWVRTYRGDIDDEAAA